MSVCILTMLHATGGAIFFSLGANEAPLLTTDGHVTSILP